MRRSSSGSRERRFEVLPMMPRDNDGEPRVTFSVSGETRSGVWRLLIGFVALMTSLATLAGPRALRAERPGAADAPTIESILDIKHPSDPEWSPDGRHVAFLWERTGLQNVWVVDFDGPRSRPPRQLTHFDQGLIQGMFWRGDSAAVFFTRAGDLWRIAIDGTDSPQAVWTTPEAETGVTPSPAGDRVAFSRRGDIWVRSLTDGDERRLTSSPAAEGGPRWSPDGRRIAFTTSQGVSRSQPFDYFGSKILFSWNERTAPSQVAVVSVADGRIVPAAPAAGSEQGARWADAEHLTVERIDEAYKTREIVLVDAATGTGRVLYRNVEETWFNLTYNGAVPTPSPDGRWVAFLGDRDGWDQVNVIATADGTVTQLTRGASDVSRLAWSPDSRRVAYDLDDVGAVGRKHLAIVDVIGGAAQPRVLTHGRGTNTEAAWSPSGDRILYQHTDPHNSADLFVIPTTNSNATPVRLTDSMPPAIDRRTFVEPRLVSYASSDGQNVPAQLFVPSNLDRSRKHPAIVWIHGDTVNQNYDGWHIQRNYAVYYSFHQYLLQKGYVVLAPDFRGSIGYGKSWRQAVYGDFGGQQYRDVAAGVGFLKGLGFVDTERVGVWGLSGGGFLTLQAVTTTPTLFRCAVDVAGVTDFGDHLRDPNPPFLLARLRPRDENPKQYEQAAPIRRVDRIARPLLVLAGTADTNVPFEQSARLVDGLLKNGKDIEFMMYPGEAHYFRREHVLRDAWRRVERFFDRHLQERAARDSP
jgi:dipeptidyl aminopeptidase/acylaminoacyl peptidase